MAGLGYTGQNQSAATSGAFTDAGGGLSGFNFNLGSAGIQKGVPTWALAAGLAIAAFIAYKLAKR